MGDHLVANEKNNKKHAGIDNSVEKFVRDVRYSQRSGACLDSTEKITFFRNIANNGPIQ